MATESIRKRALSALVTQIAAGVRGTPTFFTDLSGQAQVSSLVQTRDQRMRQPFNHWVYVFDGAETFSEPDATGKAFSAELEFVIVLMVRDRTSAPMIEELNDLVHDVMLALGLDTTLGGLVSNLRPASVESPIYDIADLEGITAIRALCNYDFVTGSTI